MNASRLRQLTNHSIMPLPVRAGLAVALACSSLLLLTPSPAHAQGVGVRQDAGQQLEDAFRQRAEVEARAQELERRAAEATEAGDLRLAERLIRQHIEIQPGNFVPHYNLASVLAMRGEREEAIAALIRAIEHGFIDRRVLESDENLRALRDHERFRAIVQNWDSVIQARADADRQRLRSQFSPSRYAHVNDDELRLLYASAFEPESFRAAQEEIRTLAAWGLREIFHDLKDPPMDEADPWVAVILPTSRDFRAWAIANYGPRAVMGEFHQIGGSYDHDRKELISQDIGATFRHEFFHVLHWRSCMRHGQVHPAWIQEGLCSLVEDYDIDADGNISPAPSWRTNIAKRLERGRAIMSIRDLAEMPRDRFMEYRPLANYAQARALMLFMYQQGVLGDWYQRYIREFDEDPSGVSAMEAVFNTRLERIEERYHNWLRSLPEIPEELSPGMASLGLEVGAGDGEGPVVRRLRSRQAQDAGLRRGDIITALDQQPARDIKELVRRLSSLSPGRTVRIDYRRGREHHSTTLELTRHE